MGLVDRQVTGCSDLHRWSWDLPGAHRKEEELRSLLQEGHEMLLPGSRETEHASVMTERMTERTESIE